MYIYLIYFVIIIIGAFAPIRLEKLVQFYILSFALDNLRIYDVSITNIFSTILLIKLIFNLNIINFFYFSKTSILLIIFNFIALVSYLISLNKNGFKSFISITTLIFITICISKLVQKEKYRTLIFNSIINLSGLVALSVVIEAILFFVFHIQVKENDYVLQNLQVYFHFSSGFFESNALAVIHIIPGVIISLFNKNNSRKISICYKILVWAGLIATFTRGGIIVAILALFIILIQTLYNNKKYFKFIAAIILPSSVVIFSIIINFISNFNISSYVARLFIIQGTIKAILSNPFFGKGLASLVNPIATNYDALDELKISELAFDTIDKREAHNTILQIALETGLLGLYEINLVNYWILNIFFK